MSLLIHVDGGSRGNPGPAGAGVVIRTSEGRCIHEAGYYLGRQTNNAAEYMALIRALRRAALCAAQPITICSDSELLVRQMTGSYRVRNAKLAGLFHEAQLLLLRISTWQFRHVPREQNRRADELANMAMDAGRDVIVFDDGAAGDAAAPAPAAGDDQPSMPAPADVTEPPPARPVRVSPAAPSADSSCPAGAWLERSIVVAERLPAGMCVHAAQAILPTLLAIQNTELSELAAVPTLTVRCPVAACGAAFHISPQAHGNGSAKRPPAG